MANKRKRDEWGDSDLDEIVPGRQTLPVANLPPDFDQEPQDGMQYLFLVRRDARRLPHTTRARNPYQVSETEVVHTSTSSPTDALPCEEWRVAFQTHFSSLRKNLTQPTIHVDRDHSGAKRSVIPEKRDRDAWWSFLAGHPNSAWHPRARPTQKRLANLCCSQSPADPAGTALSGDVTVPLDVLPRDEPSGLSITCPDDLPRNAPGRPTSFGPLQSVEAMAAPSFTVDPPTSPEEMRKKHVERLWPPEVTPSHLREIDHRMSIHLLMYFTHWINVHLQNPGDPLTAISAGHGQWIFALLTKIEDQLSADEMNLLRNLARACLGLVQRHRGKHAKQDAVSERASNPVLVENTVPMSDASCWMVFAAVAGYWGQRDLWTDAAVTLAI